MNTAMKNSTITLISTMNKSTIPPDGFAIADLERGGWRNIAMQDADGNTHRMTLDTSWKNLIVHVSQLSCTTRLAILLLIEQRERSVGDLQVGLDELLPENAPHTQPRVSHHKKELLHAGFFDDERRGKKIISRLTNSSIEFLQKIRDLLRDGNIFPDPVLSLERYTVTPVTLEATTVVASLLAEQNRMNILTLLNNDEKTVTHMCELLELTQPAISYHLEILLRNGFIHKREEGRYNFYSLTPLGKTTITAIDSWRKNYGITTLASSAKTKPTH